MIIQKTFSMKEALVEISYAVLKRHLPENFEHGQVICDFNDDQTFTITVMDKAEVKKTN